MSDSPLHDPLTSLRHLTQIDSRSTRFFLELERPDGGQVRGDRREAHLPGLHQGNILHYQKDVIKA